ncbi:hypothetical protein Nepgr_027634 [Nepenthes gracilis]|uniref:PH domain-containing protein n=1 Tax=Nepenthes gracilis TaxID=150966 RepID=A0AAD3TBQ7_NEPGR|nr:hypothetical protein Nepgr_027634 [Nepenthes gracilis]
MLYAHTALRGAATMKARTAKEMCNIAAVLPMERGLGMGMGMKTDSYTFQTGELFAKQDFFSLCSERLLAGGGELLKRTRTGELHWKRVSVYINDLDQVVLKMKSRRVAGTLTKKKKKILVEVYKDIPAWPERCLVEGAEERRYFGLKTVAGRVIQFECRNQQEFNVWTHGISRLLGVAKERRLKYFGVL